MSILSSTKSGIRGVYLTVDDYIKRGYIVGQFDNNPYAPTKLWYDKDHYITREDAIRRDRPNGPDYVYTFHTWGLPRFYIVNIKDLELVENFWKAKLPKTKASYKRKMEKAMNAKHEKRLHRWEDTWSNWAINN